MRGYRVTGPSDEQLILEARSGGREAFDLLVGRWEGPLYSLAYRFLGHPEEARDVCQETFLRVYSEAERFREGAKFSTWMYQIALNLCRDITRKRRRWDRILVSPVSRRSDDGRVIPFDPTDRSEGAEQEAIRSAERKRLRAALETIPQEQREVVVMKEFQGLKFREIAEILGCPESTVKSRMYYGLVSLRHAFGEPENRAVERSGS